MQEIEELIKQNQRLIYKLTYYFDSQNKDDLFQAGSMGLIKAYKNYNKDYGIKFTTYAYPYILGEMRKLVRQDQSLKVSTELSRLRLKIEKVSVLLSQKLMREPSVSELASYLEIDESVVIDAIRSKQSVESLDRPLILDEHLSLHEVIPNSEAMDFDNLLFLKEQLESLSDFEKKLIEKRYFEDMTQSETAKMLGISQVQVSRKEQKVLTKLKDKMVA